MRVLQPRTGLQDELDRLVVGQLPALGQGGTRHVLHHDEEAPARLARVVDLHDVGVGKPARQPGLTQKARTNAFVGAELLHEDLERNAAAQLLVPRQVHHCHRPPAERALDPVAVAGNGLAQSLPPHRRHRAGPLHPRASTIACRQRPGYRPYRRYPLARHRVCRCRRRRLESSRMLHRSMSCWLNRLET